MPPSRSDKILGTLVVVVLKARNLKDSHTFYKQDPYTLIRLGGTGKQTKVDPKGGQHPVWDAELHLPVLEDIPGVDLRTLTVSVYSRETKVDQLIGEGKADISETLKKGEFDDWVKLEMNGGYAGEVYLEMTFYSTKPPPARRPSKLSPNGRVWRPPVTPPKDTTSPNISPQPSPRMPPNTNYSPVFPSPSSSHLSPIPPHVPPLPSIHPSSPPRQTYIDPTLKNIPFLEVGSPAFGTPSIPQQPAPAPYPVPAVLRPSNPKSSPIPVGHREHEYPDVPPKYDDPNKRFRPTLPGNDVAFATQHAQRERVSAERLRAERAEADLARRLAMKDEGVVPGGWVYKQ